MNERMYGTRKIGKPRNRWGDQVKEDIKKLKIKKTGRPQLNKERVGEKSSRKPRCIMDCRATE